MKKLNTFQYELLLETALNTLGKTVEQTQKVIGEYETDSKLGDLSIRNFLLQANMAAIMKIAMPEKIGPDAQKHIDLMEKITEGLSTPSKNVMSEYRKSLEEFRKDFLMRADKH